MAGTDLERAEKRYEQAKARLQSLRNREATKQRKLDTRRKVILGGALVDLAARDDGAAALLDRLVRNLARDQDRKAFEDWARPGATTTASAATSVPDPVSVATSVASDGPGNVGAASEATSASGPA